MEDLEQESGEQTRRGMERERLSGSILGLRGDAVNCGEVRGSSFSRSLNRDAIQRTRVLKMRARYGTAEAVPLSKTNTEILATPE
jgi:hypothetical protein